MKALLIFSSQYGNTSYNWSNVYACDAEDFVFTPIGSSNIDEQSMATAIDKLVAGRTKTTNIWIGTQSIHSGNFGSFTSASTVTTYLANVYKKLSTASKAKVKGAYMNQESFYTPSLNYTNFASNTEVKTMIGIKDWVKSGNLGTNGKGFLWIPYYGYGTNAATIIKNIAYAADSVQIFDYCILQPHYFFEPSTAPGNLAGVKYSIDANKVCYRDGVKVIANKVSSTVIGFEMEYQTSVSEARYKEYTDTFANSKSKQQAFYIAGYADATTIGKVNDWY